MVRLHHQVGRFLSPIPISRNRTALFAHALDPRGVTWPLAAIHILGQEKLLSKLGKHKRGKGCLYIRTLGDVDLKVLEQLIVAAVTEKKSRYGDSHSGD